MKRDRGRCVRRVGRPLRQQPRRRRRRQAAGGRARTHACSTTPRASCAVHSSLSSHSRSEFYVALRLFPLALYRRGQKPCSSLKQAAPVAKSVASSPSWAASYTFTLPRPLAPSLAASLPPFLPLSIQFVPPLDGLSRKRKPWRSLGLVRSSPSHKSNVLSAFYS